MAPGFESCLQIFPSADITKTAEFYQRIGFRAAFWLDSEQPHVCLYRDEIEIVLTQSKNQEIKPNREINGTGYDAYFVSGNLLAIQMELEQKGVVIVKRLGKTDYASDEFVFEDVDRRWIGVGKKVDSQS